MKFVDRVIEKFRMTRKNFFLRDYSCKISEFIKISLLSLIFMYFVLLVSFLLQFPKDILPFDALDSYFNNPGSIRGLQIKSFSYLLQSIPWGIGAIIKIMGDYFNADLSPVWMLQLLVILFVPFLLAVLIIDILLSHLQYGLTKKRKKQVELQQQQRYDYDKWTLLEIIDEEYRKLISNSKTREKDNYFLKHSRSYPDSCKLISTAQRNLYKNIYQQLEKRYEKPQKERFKYLFNTLTVAVAIVTFIASVYGVKWTEIQLIFVICFILLISFMLSFIFSKYSIKHETVIDHNEVIINKNEEVKYLLDILEDVAILGLPVKKPALLYRKPFSIKRILSYVVIRIRRMMRILKKNIRENFHDN